MHPNLAPSRCDRRDRIARRGLVTETLATPAGEASTPPGSARWSMFSETNRRERTSQCLPTSSVGPPRARRAQALNSGRPTRLESMGKHSTRRHPSRLIPGVAPVRKRCFPARDGVRDAGRSSDDENRRVVGGCSGGAEQRRIARKHDRPGRRVDLLAVDLKTACSVSTGEELLVAVRLVLLVIGLVMFFDHLVAAFPVAALTPTPGRRNGGGRDGTRSR
jgi:hypothetical protein